MRACALPLQILLAVALVLNGIGGAMAGVLVPMPVAGAVSAAIVANVELPARSGDCEGHGDAFAAGTERHAHAHAHADTPPAPSACHSADGPDCSDSPQCRQACLHVSVAVAPVLLVGVIQPHAEASLHRLAAGHPAPPLPSPIRPPIA